MYKSIPINSSKEKFLDRYTFLETDPQNHAGLPICIKMAKGWTNLRF